MDWNVYIRHGEFNSLVEKEKDKKRDTIYIRVRKNFSKLLFGYLGKA